jgi:hypothetical protein
VVNKDNDDKYNKHSPIQEEMEMESLTKNAAHFSMTQYHAVVVEAETSTTTTHFPGPIHHPPLHFEVDKEEDEIDNDEKDDHHPSRLYHRRRIRHPQMCDYRSSSSSSSDEGLEPDASSSPRMLSQAQAMILLIKGNLGPGCLNLPNAFASIGWKWATYLFAGIALQGIYSMWVLVDCKNMLLLVQQQQNPDAAIATTATTTTRRRPLHETTTINASEPLTFMDVASLALGKPGRRLVEFFLMTLQGGVCCVFLSLIATNLLAWNLISSPAMAIGCVTLVLHGIVLLRFLSDLTWLSATANLFMMTAILTATIAGIQSAVQNHPNPNLPPAMEPENALWFLPYAHRSAIISINNNTATTSVSAHFISKTATFVSDMFFAFEGIGLVLPIENSYTPLATTTTIHHHHRSSSSTSPSFSTVLIRSMMITASLFLLIGIPASMGFPDIASGSVTAYLEQRYPHNLWYSIVNGLVMMAVLFTFPLQLTPAIEVLDRWLDSACCSWLSRSGYASMYNHNENTDAAVAPSSEHVNLTQQPTANHPWEEGHVVVPVVSTVEEKCHHHDDVLSIESASGASDDDDNVHRTHFWPCSFRIQKYHWILRRWFVVLTCATIVYMVGNNLGLLIALFGAIGQTGLAGMPCAIHLALQRKGIAPNTSVFRTVMDYGILAFCGLVMIMGVTFALKNIASQGGS